MTGMMGMVEVVTPLLPLLPLLCDRPGRTPGMTGRPTPCPAFYGCRVGFNQRNIAVSRPSYRYKSTLFLSPPIQSPRLTCSPSTQLPQHPWPWPPLPTESCGSCRSTRASSVLLVDVPPTATAFFIYYYNTTAGVITERLHLTATCFVLRHSPSDFSSHVAFT